MFPAGGHLGFWIGPKQIHHKLPCKAPENLERKFSHQKLFIFQKLAHERVLICP